jgi:hypothetical protein
MFDTIGTLQALYHDHCAAASRQTSVSELGMNLEACNGDPSYVLFT